MTMIKIFITIIILTCLSFLSWMMITVDMEKNEAFYIPWTKSPVLRRYNWSDYKTGVIKTVENLRKEFQASNFRKLNLSDVSIGSNLTEDQVKNVLILTSVRSGSSFLAELLNQYPGTFFYFEPLHYHSTNKDHESELISQHDLLQSLFTCNFTNDTQGFLQHAKSHLFLFNRQVPRRLWNSCVSFRRPKESVCMSQEYLNTVCPLYPIRLIKTVRMKMRDTRHLLETLTNLKILVLVRDPRAVFRSRWSDSISSWCRSQQCSDPETSCRDLEQDVDDTETLGDMFPGRVKLVRYEDISLNTVSALRSMLSFIGLPWQESLKRYIVSHTQREQVRRVRKKMVKVQDPYTTIRNSTAAVLSWTRSLSRDNVTMIQRVCSGPMSTLGYKPVDTETTVMSGVQLQDILSVDWLTQNNTDL